MPSGQALVEREEQQARLAGLLAEVERGAGALALVTGEAGIGKTSLVRAFCAGLPSGVRVLRGGCDPVEAPRPLGPLHEVGLQVGSQLAAVLAGDETRLHRFRALQETLATGPPTVLVVEDVHWADDATLDLLTFLGRRADSLHALVVLTSRDRAGHVRADRVIGDLVTLPAVHRVEVPALTVEGLRALGEVEDAELLHRRTGGNPFFVSEVLASGGTGVPTNVRDAVLSRTAGLSPAARDVVELVSVVPDHADLELVGAATAAAPGSLDECQAAGLLVPVQRGLGFRHEIAREAVESSLTAARSAELHATVLRELSRRPGSRDAVLSHHADLAGDGTAVLRHAPRAASQASRLGAHRESVIHLDRALRYAGRLDLPAHATLLGARAAELEALGDATAALATSDEAVLVRRTAGDEVALAVALADQARRQWTAVQAAASARTLAEAVELAETTGDPRALCAAYTVASLLRMLARDLPEAIRLGELAVGLARATGDAARLSRALNSLGTAHWFGDVDRAEALLVEAIEVARRAQDDAAVAHALVNLGSGAGEVRRYATAERWLAEAVAWCTARDLDARGSYAAAWLARVRFEQGRWAEVDELAAPLLEDPTAISRLTALATLGRLRSRTGGSGADALLETAWELAVRTGDLQRLWPVAAARAERALLSGHGDRVAALVEDTLALAVEREHPWAVGELAVLLRRSGADPGRPHAEGTPYAAELAGDFARAARDWDELGCPWEAALARAETDDPVALARAVTVLHGLGARSAADQVAARLRALGGTVPRRPQQRTRAHPSGLTAREVEVLDLLVEGLTDAELATRLHISVKTAGHHVSAVIAKLGVTSRREAAARR